MSAMAALQHIFVNYAEHFLFKKRFAVGATPRFWQPHNPSPRVLWTRFLFFRFYQATVTIAVQVPAESVAI